MADHILKQKFESLIQSHSVTAGTYIMSHLLSHKLILAGFEPKANNLNQFNRISKSEDPTYESSLRRSKSKGQSKGPSQRAIILLPGKMITLTACSRAHLATKGTWLEITTELTDAKLGYAKNILLTNGKTSKRSGGKKSSVFIKREYDNDWAEEIKTEFINSLESYSITLEEYESAFYASGEKELTNDSDSSLSSQDNRRVTKDNDKPDSESNESNTSYLEDHDDLKKRTASLNSALPHVDPTLQKKINILLDKDNLNLEQKG